LLQSPVETRGKKISKYLCTTVSQLSISLYINFINIQLNIAQKHNIASEKEIKIHIFSKCNYLECP
jgi:hypothetical protein